MMCVHSFLLFCIFTPLSLQRANAMQRVIFNFDFTCLCCFCCHRRFLCCSSNYLYANKLFIPTFWWTGYNVLDHHHKHQGLWRSWQEYKDCRVDFDDSRAFSKNKSTNEDCGVQGVQESVAVVDWLDRHTVCLIVKWESRNWNVK